MPRFVDLDPAQFAGALVIVDVDGTITHDRNKRVDLDAEIRLTELAREADVYLCSNGPDAERTRMIAESIPGVRYLESIYKKPNKLALGSVDVPEGKRVVVIGDKHLTDGRFAKNIGAEFVQVARIRAMQEKPMLIIVYFADDLYMVLRRFFAKVRAYVSLMRTRQWVKNALIFAPLFFAADAFNLSRTFLSFEAFAAFCIAASAVYVINDVVDADADRAHPKKRRRPIASGAISSSAAWVFSLALFAFAGFLASAVPAVIPVIAGYIGLNIVYTFALKRVAILDTVCVAVFYVMRIAAGGAATGIYVSPWIILCVFFGALFLALGKRRAEFGHSSRRSVIAQYSRDGLDQLLAGSAILALISYGLYSIIGSKSPLAVYSTVFVACAIFRLLNRMYAQEGFAEAETPEVMIFRDPWALASFAAWGVYMFAILYR